MSLSLLRRALIAGCALALSSCSPLSLLAGSRTVPKGDWETGAMVGVGLDRLDRSCPTCPTLDAVIRRGLTDSFDLGLRVFSLGAALEGRFQLYESPPEDWPGVSALVSLAPGARAGPVCESDFCRFGAIAFAQLSVVAGLHLAHWLEVALAPQALFELGGSRVSIHAGGSFALVFHLPRKWTLAPEVSCLIPSFPDPLPFPRVHFGVGVLKAF